MIKIEHWKILHSVYWLQTELSGPISMDISDHTGIELSTVISFASRMCDDDWSDFGPWLMRINQQYFVAGQKRHDCSSGGYLALESAVANPGLDGFETDKWVNEALTGLRFDGRRSRIENPVVPRFSRTGYCDPEKSAYKRNKKWAQKEESKKCPDCQTEKKISEFRADKKLCLECHAHRSRVRRHERNKVEKKSIERSSRK